MKILVAGAGTRAFAVAKSVEKYGGTAYLLPEIAAEGYFRTLACDPSEPESVAAAAEKAQISLVTITDEKIMLSPLSDMLEGKGIRVFASPQRTAEIFSDREAVTKLARSANVPTQRRITFSTEAEAKDFILSGVDREYVIKSPRKGGGVFPAATKAEATAAVGKIFATENSVVIEARVFGHRMGVGVITDGKTLIFAPTTLPSRDARLRSYGAAAPNPYYNERVRDETETQIVYPFLTAARKAGIKLCGWYNFDIVLTGYGPIFIGIDCVPPETELETVLSLISSDLAAAMASATCGTLNRGDIKFSDDYALTVASDDKSACKRERKIEKTAYVYLNFGQVVLSDDVMTPLADRLATVTVATPTFNSAYHGAMDVAELSGLCGEFCRDVGSDAYAEICRIRLVGNAKKARLDEIERNREIIRNARLTEFDYSDPEYLERLKNSSVFAIDEEEK